MQEQIYALHKPEIREVAFVDRKPVLEESVENRHHTSPAKASKVDADDEWVFVSSEKKEDTHKKENTGFIKALTETTLVKALKNIGNDPLSSNRTENDTLSIEWKSGDTVVGLTSKLNAYKEAVNLKCRAITNKVLKVIVASCPLLKKVDLSHCTEITDDGIYQLIKGCRSIEELNLTGCTQVDNAFIREVSQCASLKHLILAGCREVTDLGFESLRTNAKNLKILNLSDCTQLNDEEIDVIKGMKSLEAVIIWKCKNVSDAAKKKLEANKIKVIDHEWVDAANG